MSDGVRHPQLRGLLIAALEALCDPAFQQRVWIRGEIDPRDRYHVDFDQVVHTIWDDLRFGEAPLRSIGFTTRNRDEADAVAAVAAGIDGLLERYGTDRSDEEYMRTPEWTELGTLARSALHTLTA